MVANRMDKSLSLFALAKEHLAGGVGSGTRSPMSGWVPCPVYVSHGDGARLYDVDGNEFIDYAMGLGPLILGHRPKPVIDRVIQTISERGTLFALAHDLEGQAAKKVSECVPSVESLRFTNSGTEAVCGALRLARAYTGKTRIIRFEGHYHGWNDLIHWSNQAPLTAAGRRQYPRPVPNSTGIPECLAETLIVLPWNDLGALETAIKRYGHETAAVITEPILGNVGGLMPEPGYLEGMRRLTADHDILLIFDEVLTGFRVALGGVQGQLKIAPDITVMAKAIAAGFPVAAFGGRRELMDLIAKGETMHGGTYNSNPLCMSAVLASLDELSKPGFYEKLNGMGERLAKGLVEAAHRAGFPATWSGVGALFQVWFAERAPKDYREALPIMENNPYMSWWAGLISRGLLVQPGQDKLWLISGAHSGGDVDETLAKAEDALKELKLRR